MNLRMRVVVHGRVQGVAFRHYTHLRALESGVTGWVRNRPDGSVEAVFEGTEKAVQEMVECCRSGPPAALVERLDANLEDYAGEFDSFTVTH